MKMTARQLYLLLTIGLSLCLTTSPTVAQDCESEVAAHLKPVKEDSGLSWAMELTGQIGYLGNSDLDRGLANGMVFLGLHYRSSLSSAHRFYFEGGYKDWHKSDQGPGLGGTGQTWGDFPTPAKDHWGLREAYYDFGGGKTQLTGGLHTASLDENLLLDERAVGVSLKRTFGSYTLKVATGGVMSQFARMKDFCATRHVYRIVRGGRVNLIGDKFGETNFAGGTFSWSPSPSTEPDSFGAPGEEEDDEFVAFDEEFASLEDYEGSFVKRIGIVFYEEFGSGFETNRLYYGGLAELGLSSEFELQVELIHQHVTENRVLGYLIRGGQDFTWRSGALTSLWGGYIGSADIDPNARFAPAFSNLFLGEVMRLDVVHLPLVFGRVKHSLPWKGKPAIGFFAVGQTSGARSEEYDFEAELHLARGLRLYGVVGFVRSAALSGRTMVGRVQMRYAF
jgi:hypothetical protein